MWIFWDTGRFSPRNVLELVAVSASPYGPAFEEVEAAAAAAPAGGDVPGAGGDGKCAQTSSKSNLSESEYRTELGRLAGTLQTAATPCGVSPGAPPTPTT